jgi:hypothetical protein
MCLINWIIHTRQQIYIFRKVGPLLINIVGYACCLAYIAINNSNLTTKRRLKMKIKKVRRKAKGLCKCKTAC